MSRPARGHQGSLHGFSDGADAECEPSIYAWISVASGKGGVGKSTDAIDLAAPCGDTAVGR